MQPNIYEGFINPQNTNVLQTYTALGGYMLRRASAISPQGLLMNYINEFRKKLQKEAETLNGEYLQREARKEIELEIFKETSTPVLERLKRLIASIPTVEKDIPRSLEWYRSKLRGVQGRGAHAGQIGTALHTLGFERKRAWSDSQNGFKALWYPPN